MAMTLPYHEAILLRLLGYRVKFFRNLCCSALLSISLSGCSTGSYLLQAAGGHLSVLNAATPITELLDQPGTPERLNKQLRLVLNIRDYSVQEMGLPDNSSYRSYADLKRPYVVWNVVATPVDSMKPQSWCFLFIGCISYKGFYSESDAHHFGDMLRMQGFDVAVMGVPAYSTLGFTADPVLNTFVFYPAGELARMIFHELAHQVVYIPDDTRFNESFATALEEIGVDAWLGQPAQQALRDEYRVFDRRRVQFRALLAKARADLELIYQHPGNESRSVEKPAVGRGKVLELKQARFQQLRTEYQALKFAWGGWAGYDRFMSEDLNNAKLAISGLYTQHVPAFKALFAAYHSDFKKFYRAVEQLGKYSREDREAILEQYSVMARHSHSIEGSNPHGVYGGYEPFTNSLSSQQPTAFTFEFPRAAGCAAHP